MSFALWVLTSLVAIALIGDTPYLALAVTVLAGVALALNIYLDFHARPLPAVGAPQGARVTQNSSSHFVTKYHCERSVRSNLGTKSETPALAAGASVASSQTLAPPARAGEPLLATLAPHASAGVTRAEQLRRFWELVARFGWVLDVAIAALLIFPTRWMALGFLLVPLAWLARGRAYKRVVPQTAFNLPILLILTMVLVSLWASADLAVSLIPLGQIVAGVNAFYAIAARAESQSDIYWITAGLILLGAGLALVAPFAVEWNKNKLFALPQIYSRFRQVLPETINGNVLAGALVLVFSLGASLLIHAPCAPLSPRNRRIAQTFLAVSIALIAAVLLLTQSRGGIMAAALALFLIVLVRTRWVLAPVLLALVGVGFWMSSQPDLPRIVDLFFSSDAVSGLAGREEVWSRAVYALQDVPFTGIGLGIFSRAVQVLYPLFLVGPDVDIGHAHNLFLQVGVDLGIPGLVAYVALLTIGLVTALRAFLTLGRRREPDQAALWLGLGIGLIALVVHGLVDAVTWGTKPAILFWILLGVMAAQDRRDRDWVVGANSQGNG